MAEQPKVEPAVRGGPLPWTDAELDALSTVSAVDVDAAVALWQRHVTGRLRELLDGPRAGRKG